MTTDNCTIGIAQPAPPTVLIQNPLTSRHLLSIHPDGTVTGEIEDASETARVFVEHIRGMVAQTTQSDALREAVIEECANALEADAKLCDCAALEERECACGAWCEWKSITSARAIEIVRELKNVPPPEGDGGQ